jgi:hypothetical protein
MLFSPAAIAASIRANALGGTRAARRAMIGDEMAPNDACAKAS